MHKKKHILISKILFSKCLVHASNNDVKCLAKNILFNIILVYLDMIVF